MTDIELLEKHNVYGEKTVRNMYCYKHQPEGEEIIMVQQNSQEEAARLMVNSLIGIGFFKEKDNL